MWFIIAESQSYLKYDLCLCMSSLLPVQSQLKNCWIIPNITTGRYTTKDNKTFLANLKLFIE